MACDQRPQAASKNEKQGYKGPKFAKASGLHSSRKSEFNVNPKFIQEQSKVKARMRARRNERNKPNAPPPNKTCKEMHLGALTENPQKLSTAVGVDAPSASSTTTATSLPGLSKIA